MRGSAGARRAGIAALLALVVLSSSVVVDASGARPHPPVGPVSGSPSPTAGRAASPPPPGWSRPSAGGLATQYSLFLGNGTLLRGNVLASVPRDPTYAAYDARTGLVYASDGSSTLWKVDPSRGEIVGSLVVGHSVGNLFALPTNGDLVLDSSGVVYVVDPTNGTVVEQVSAGNASAGTDGTFTYDPTTNDVWVTNQFASHLDVVNLSSASVVATISVGGGFNDILSGFYDAKNGNVYLDYYENEVVEVLNGQTMRFVTNVSLTSSYCCFSYGLTVDPVSGNVYVGAGLYGFGSYLVEIAGSNNTVVGSTGLGSYLSNGVYDPNSGYLFVADASQSRLYAVNPANRSVVGSIALPRERTLIYTQWWPTVVPALDQVYVPTDYSNTLDLAVPTNLTNATSVVNVANPVAMAYDAACGCAVVADSNSGRLEFVNPATMQELGSAPLAGDPYGVAYDNRSGDLWVTLGGFFGTNGIEVLNGKNGSEVGLLSDGSTPWGVTYDPSNDHVYVADYFGDQVRVFYGANRTQEKVIPAGNQTTGIVYVPSDQSVYATNWNSGNLTVVNATSDTVRGAIRVRGAPEAIGYDARENLLFVGNNANPNTTVVNVTTDNVTGSVPVNYTSGLAFSNLTGAAFLLNGTADVAVVNGTSLATTFVPAGLATGVGLWVPSGGLLAGDGSTGAVYEVNATAPSLLSNLALVATPERASTYGTLRFTTESSGGPGNLTYRYSGLPPGCSSSNVSSLVCQPQVSGTYQVRSTVQGSGLAPQTVDATVWVQPAFSVNVEVSGLPPDAVWTLNVSGAPGMRTNGTVLSLTLPNGTYFYVATSAGFGTVRGTIPIAGSPVTLHVRFTAYQLALTESGLPAGSSWWAVVPGRGTFAFSSATGTILEVPNGTYTVTFGTSAAGWSAPQVVAVVQGSSIRANGAFAQVTYAVTLAETGLAPSTVWRLAISGRAPFTTSSPSVTLPFANGSYTIDASVPSGGWSSASGGFLVQGASAATTLEFVPVLYRHDFRASGLPTGGTWSVTVTPGSSVQGTAPVLSAWTPNGSFSFAVHGPSGWTPTPANGTFRANATAGTTNVTFVPVTSVPGPSVTAFTVDPSSIDLGGNLTFLTTVHGGAPPIRFSYSGLPSGCSGVDAAVLGCSPSAVGSGKVTVVVTDAAGRTSSASSTYSVVAAEAVTTPASPSPSGTSVTTLVEYLALGAVVGVAAVLALALAMRPRRGVSAPSEPPTPESEPSVAVADTPPTPFEEGAEPATETTWDEAPPTE